VAKAAAKQAVMPKSTVEIFDDVEQLSEEWFGLRLGLPTASNFATIMASGRDGGDSKTRTKLLYDLAGELLTGLPAEGYSNFAMERGKQMEAAAREQYMRTHFDDVRRVGFIRNKLPNGRHVGASPDALVGAARALEIKTMIPRLMIEQLVKGAGMPPEHRAQIQGTMWVGELEAVDLILFYQGMPVTPKFSVARDDAYIKEISNAIEIFDHELHKLVAKIRAMGGTK